MLVALLLAVVLAAFSPVLWTGFSPLDDYNFLLNNPSFNPPTWTTLWEHLTQPAFRIYTPVTTAIWHAIALISNKPTAGRVFPIVLLPIGFKIASVLVHVLSAVAVGWALRMLTAGRLAAFAGAAIFALHPVQVEAVAWTTGLKDLLCGLFCVLTVGFYARYCRTNAKQDWWLAIITAALATGSKPTAMVLPALLVIVEWYLRPTTDVVEIRKRLIKLVPFVLLAAGIGITMLVIQARPNVFYVPLWQRPLVAGDAVAFYLGKIFWPVHLSVDYTRSPQAVLLSKIVLFTVAMTGMVVFLVIYTLVRTRPTDPAGLDTHSDRRLALGGLFFLIPILPVSGLVPFDMQQYSTVADHYLYLPMFGIAVVIANLLEKVIRPGFEVVESDNPADTTSASGHASDSPTVRRRKKCVIGGGVAITLILGMLSLQRATLWTSQQRLWERNAIDRPNSFLANGSLAILALEREDFAAADALAKRSLDLHETPTALDTLAVVALRQYRYDDASSYASRSLELGGSELSRVQKVMRLAVVISDDRLARRAADLWWQLEPGNPEPMALLQSLQRAKDIRQEK